MPTNKSEIINKLSNNYPNFIKKDLKKIFEIFISEVMNSLKRHDRVELRDVFTLEPKLKKSRIARNPKTNEKIYVKEKYSILFKSSKKWIEKINDTITVKVISTDNKGLNVQPEGCELEFLIKKSNIALNSSDARPSRFVGGERIDAAISELNFEKRKVSLSIKLLEELQNKEAVTKFSSPLSGKNLPFSSLSEKLSDKKNKDDE